MEYKKNIVHCSAVPDVCFFLRCTTEPLLFAVSVKEGCPTSVKEDCPTDDELEYLSRKIGKDWKALGRRLGFENAQLTGFAKDNDEFSEKAYAMLEKWKSKEGSDATYRVLYKALCHDLVGRRNLAEEICCNSE